MLLAFAATTSVATAQRHRSNRQTTKTATKSNPNAADLKLIERAISGIATAQDSLCEKVFNWKFDKKAFTTSNVSAIKSKADAGEAWAQDIIGELYNQGLGGYSKNLPKCVEWYIKSADQGFVWGQVNLAIRYEEGEGVNENDYEAVKWYRKAAEQGHAEAQCSLGDHYYTGEGVPKDYNEAVKWYRKAAEQGDAEAMNNLGECYEEGEGVSKDYNEAVKWYRKAAEQGYARAQKNLGLCYHDGNGVTQDYTEAVKWYRKAIEKGDDTAMNNLGYCYEYGEGVQQSNSEARKWYQKAAKLGNETAQENLERLDCPDFNGSWTYYYYDNYFTFDLELDFKTKIINGYWIIGNGGAHEVTGRVVGKTAILEVESMGTYKCTLANNGDLKAKFMNSGKVFTYERDE